MKMFIEGNKKAIETFQNAVIMSLSSLIYSEYIKNIKQQRFPIIMTWVPQITTVKELLKPESYLVKLLSESLIDKITERQLFQDYKDSIPELNIFNDENDNIELLKFTFDYYIMHNAFYNISNTISKKFDLNNPDNNTFRESRDLDLFNRIPITERQLDYIVDETILQWFVMLDSIKKRIDYPSDNTEVFLVEGEILSIDHTNAICPVMINDDIFNNEEVFPLLSFVTSTTISEHEHSVSYMFKNDKTVFHDVKSNPFNKLTTIELLK